MDDPDDADLGIRGLEFDAGDGGSGLTRNPGPFHTSRLLWSGGFVRSRFLCSGGKRSLH
jgi:hypothetical protein